jgi:leucyl-tRNA synthetase
MVPEFVNTTCPQCGGPGRRETDVSDTFLDSSWYFLRYPSAHREDVPFDPEMTRKWLPVDLYAGGIEHSTLHHLYARFITMALHDLGYLDFSEPFKKLRLHGLIIKDGAKMSKSRGNVVNPDEYVHRYGADTLRLYLLFLGPYEEGGDFTDAGIRGIIRFLTRVWRLVLEGAAEPRPAAEEPYDPAILAPMHRAIATVQGDIEALHFHTAIAAIMSYSNWLTENRAKLPDAAWREAVRTLLLLLAPLAPHIAEELWERIGEPYSIHQQPWPSYDPRLLEQRTVTLVIQVDGKVRDRVEVPAGLSAGQAREVALGRPRIARILDGRRLRDVIYVPDRLVNLVTAPAA